MLVCLCSSKISQSLDFHKCISAWKLLVYSSIAETRIHLLLLENIYGPRFVYKEAPQSRYWWKAKRNICLSRRERERRIKVTESLYDINWLYDRSSVPESGARFSPLCSLQQNLWEQRARTFVFLLDFCSQLSGDAPYAVTYCFLLLW